ncbi:MULTISPECIES: reductive dehalogenase [Sulfurospirillum]|uniref:Reductive dehalogenase n=5 Tax=Sulfurospirillum TaxID=57665 RepID=A0A1Y0HN52_9BACT|nr:MULTISPECIES: reductive dehalogenase [Sulfurospirillum]AGW23617.1 RdhA2 [Sulfurospirillum sp. mixed culture SL2]BAJ09321.1 putative tetrachloroethene reductive dehalogenase catalytically active subunit PceA1 [uncultured bacterium]AHJ12796.1 reductive dehalogenase catalytic subunit RdhA [Sulfurospirillum multivorans DSM 12446]AOO65275.1 reductive dehalogenase catalytic subunit RdhA [Sulfurospirillum halorespirans DSM 13726]ARU48755.1 reductive dehalogenase catalytic subunit RdhA [Sulfurospir
MEKKKPELSRRDFGKIVAGVGVAVTIAPFGGTDAHAKEKASQEIRHQFAMPDGVSPIKINEKYERFNEGHVAFYHPSSVMIPNFKGETKFWVFSMMDQKQNLINTAQHAPGVKAPSVAEARSARAWESAAWTLNEMLGYGKPNRKMHLWDNFKAAKDWPHIYNKAPDEKDPAILTNQIKYVTRLAGADLVGIARLNRNWIFKEAFTTVSDKPEDDNNFITKPINFKDIEKPTETEDEYIIPNSFANVIVSAFAMNRDMMQCLATSMAHAAAALCYSRMVAHDMWICQFIRNQGYYAIPSCNGVGQSVAFAVEAGLGQASRMGTIITPEYGPMVRLSKIFTNMPLIPDKPIDFGVTEFCETCKKCARDCPSKAISEGPQSYEARDIHNANGRYQWHNDHKKCLQYWVESGGDCGICVAVCPFTKGNIWIHDGVEWLIDKTRFLDPVMLGMDDALGYGKTRNVEEVWKGKINTYGLDTSHFKDTETTGKDRVKKS